MALTLHLVFEKAGAPSTRIRLRQMVSPLEARGIACRVAPYPRGAAARRAFAAELAPGDVVLVHRARPSRREARWWRSLPVGRIYDFDDAVMRGRRVGLRGMWERRRRAAGFARALECADAASCGNAWLAEQCGSLPTAWVPSAVPLDVPRHRPRTGARPFRVGWVGRSSNLRYLREIGGALAEVSRRVELEIVCVSDAALVLPGCRVRNVEWSLEGEGAAIADFDVGIMPLHPDDPWSRGKCAYKLLQYMAAGVPAVGSDVGMNAALIESGRNGRLARSDADWTETLYELAGDDAQRARLGAAGRLSAEAYGYEAVAERLAELVARVAGSSASR